MVEYQYCQHCKLSFDYLRLVKLFNFSCAGKKSNCKKNIEFFPFNFLLKWAMNFVFIIISFFIISFYGLYRSLRFVCCLRNFVGIRSAEGIKLSFNFTQSYFMCSNNNNNITHWIISGNLWQWTGSRGFFVTRCRGSEIESANDPWKIVIEGVVRELCRLRILFDGGLLKLRNKQIFITERILHGSYFSPPAFARNFHIRIYGNYCVVYASKCIIRPHILPRCIQLN